MQRDISEYDNMKQHLIVSVKDNSPLFQLFLTSDFKFVTSYSNGTLPNDHTLKNVQSYLNDLEGLDEDTDDSAKV